MLAILFGLSKTQQSASVAKERLQIIVALQRSELHQRSSIICSLLLAELNDEIIEVVKKYVAWSVENIRDIDLNVEDSSKNSTIEV
ncbi:cell division topological specificity factor MinE, partial [Francisella tularensis]|uniref:cell division topological specificity factor MinE n=1 Tax=Francisella tularensis TaxID=263 RepID=UPI002381AA5C